LVPIMKRDWSECQDGFADLIHRSNVFLKPARGVTRSELARGVYDDIYAVAVSHCPSTNITDIAPVAHVLARGTDADHIVRRGDADAGHHHKQRQVRWHSAVLNLSTTR